MKPLLIIIFLLTSSLAKCQNDLLPNEEIVLYFTTNNGKSVMLAKDQDDKYLVYRFGSDKNIELEFPKKNKDSWKLFKYSYYHRGGGPENAGMDLSHVAFTNGDFEYMIYQSYYAESESFEIGIRVENLKTNKSIDIKGDYDSKQGNLHDLPERDLLEPDNRI